MQLVAPSQLSLSELSQHDGSNPDKPMYLAIRGTIFDVTSGELSCHISHRDIVNVQCLCQIPLTMHSLLIKKWLRVLRSCLLTESGKPHNAPVPICKFWQ